MANTTQTSFRIPHDGLEKLDTLAKWLLDSRTSVVIRAINELYAREAELRNVEPYPEVDRSKTYPPYQESTE